MLVGEVELDQGPVLVTVEYEIEESLRRFEAKPTTVRHFICARNKDRT